MKKFNIICILCMLLMIGGIIYNFCALETGIFPIFHKIMLVIDGVLLGMVIGECYLGNYMVKYGCNFDRKDNNDENSKN